MKTNLIQGDEYSFLLKDGTEKKGIFVSEEKDAVFIKLRSGYNIGISKNNIKKTSLHKKKKQTPEKKSGQSQNTDILILHTGGTIASRVDYSTGAVTSRFTPEEIIEMFPGLQKHGKIGSKLISNMPSEDMTFYHYNVMLEEIKKSQGVKGIILTHGTDTLHYTAAALTFGLENLGMPVMIVGSQRSSDRPSSDAYMNLLSAATFIEQAKKERICGVFICMHEDINDEECTILRGVNARKAHTSRRDAFKPINTQAVATVNPETQKVTWIEDKKEFKANNEDFKIKKFNEDIKVGLIKSRPNMFPEELDVYKNYEGIILEGTGLGHFPISTFDKSTKKHEDILKKISVFASKKIVAMTSQADPGRINMNVYKPGRILMEKGVLGHNLNMTSETAYIKAAWLLSNHSLEEAKKLYSKNLKGEITSRTHIN